MTGKNLIKNFQALISVRVPGDIVLTNGKLKVDSENNDSKSNFSTSSGNNDENNNIES